MHRSHVCHGPSLLKVFFFIIAMFELQLFPYHLSDYVCRVLRVTPFKYYCDLLYTVMREEKSYDQIPNFAVKHRSRTCSCYSHV